MMKYIWIFYHSAKYIQIKTNSDKKMWICCNSDDLFLLICIRIFPLSTICLSLTTRFNASHSGSYSNALDLHPNVPPSDVKMAQYTPLYLCSKMSLKSQVVKYAEFYFVNILCPYNMG